MINSSTINRSFPINRNDRPDAQPTRLQRADTFCAVGIHNLWGQLLEICCMFSTPQDEEPVGFLSWNGTDVLSDLALWVLQGLFGVVPLKHKGGETPKSHPRRLTRESSMQGGDSFRLCNHISWARHGKGDYWAGRKLLWNQSTKTKQLIMVYFTGILFQNHWFNPKHFKYKKLDKSFYSSRLFLFNE